MDALLRKLKRILRQALPGCELDLEITVPGHKVGGLVIWQKFQGMEPIDRAKKVWDVLEEQLTAAEYRSVSTVLTLTPDELAAARS